MQPSCRLFQSPCGAALLDAPYITQPHRWHVGGLGLEALDDDDHRSEVPTSRPLSRRLTAAPEHSLARILGIVGTVPARLGGRVFRNHRLVRSAFFGPEPVRAPPRGMAQKFKKFKRPSVESNGMADDPTPRHIAELAKLTSELVNRVTEMSALLIEHQIYVFALQAYLEAQPGWNVFLWTQLMEKYRTQGLEGFQKDAQKWHDALLAALKAFEGKTH